MARADGGYALNDARSAVLIDASMLVGNNGQVRTHRLDQLVRTQQEIRIGGATERFLADWRRWTHTERYQLILGADILYDRALHFYLEEIFHRNLAPGGRLLLADPGRTQALEFMVKLEEHGWQVDLQTLAVKAVGEAQNRMVEVVIYQCTRVQRSAPNRSS